MSIEEQDRERRRAIELHRVLTHDQAMLATRKHKSVAPARR
jgi:hypothetical protein